MSAQEINSNRVETALQVQKTQGEQAQQEDKQTSLFDEILEDACNDFCKETKQFGYPQARPFELIFMEKFGLNLKKLIESKKSEKTQKDNRTPLINKILEDACNDFCKETKQFGYPQARPFELILMEHFGHNLTKSMEAFSEINDNFKKEHPWKYKIFKMVSGFIGTTFAGLIFNSKDTILPQQ